MIRPSHSLPAPTAPRCSEVGPAGSRWSVASATVGAVLWLAAPCVPVGAPPSFGSIEHLFLFLPLVAAPLALRLLARLLDSTIPSNDGVHGWARQAQPVAAAMVLASFFLPKGTLAGAFAGGWLVVAGMVVLGGVRRAARVPGRHGANVSCVAAHVYLPIGAAWLLLSRLGVAPFGLAAPTVFLAALHFHFSGFALQILIAATGLRMSERRSSSGALHRALAIGAAAAIPLIAAGNIGHSRIVKFAGVSAMVGSTLAFALTTTAVAREAPRRAARAMLLVSAASLSGGMVLAGIYGVGELTLRAWLGLPQMVATHGTLNAFGFTLFGLLGHLGWRPSMPRTVRGGAAAARREAQDAASVLAPERTKRSSRVS